ncbi:uncharacterized protein TNCV_4353731 [Trichonephila clavipes]|nr:uncharacterized protein TNCV_4353731 [Trichonephila clavipes]
MLKAVTGSTYLDALQLWLFPQLEESEPNKFIWQQDGAPPHWHLSVHDWLNITVTNQWIGRKEPPDKACIVWHPRSPHPTPYALCCPEADGTKNLEQPTLNHAQSDTMASAVLADPTRALQGTNQGSGLAMEESKNDVGSLEQLLMYADEHYLAEKLPMRDHLGKVLHRVDHYTSWSARKRRLELRLGSARCLEIVCETIATLTSARIVERVTVGFTSACRTILRSSLLVVFLVAPDLVFRAWVPSRVHCS